MKIISLNTLIISLTVLFSSCYDLLPPPENEFAGNLSAVSPANGAVNVNTTSLKWAYSGSGSPHFSVLISNDYGIDNELHLVAENINSNTYNYDFQVKQTYQWQIIALDNNDNVLSVSDIWTFSTIENQSPEIPQNMTPDDNEDIFSFGTAYISWYCSDPEHDDLKYDFYFGTESNPPLYKSNMTEDNILVDVINGTYYYWKIVAKDSYGNSTTGPVWKFYVRSK